MERPFQYQFSTKLTNRKWRSVKVTGVFDSDADFTLSFVWLYSTMRDLGMVCRFGKHFCIEVGAHRPIGPVAIIPRVVYPNGSELGLEFSLNENVDVGRKRPRVTLIMTGTKTYVESQTPVEHETDSAESLTEKDHDTDS